jgi:hypothetical protein
MVLFSLVISPMVASAGYVWENNITVKAQGMVWDYNEEYTGENSILFKHYIDIELGNTDGFVSAWELLKTDAKMRESLHSSIMKYMDVKINNSAEAIHVVDVDSSICCETLGKTGESAHITNCYHVIYSFDDSLLNLGNNIWFLGEPETNVTIVMPVGVDIASTEGIENATITVQNNSAVISGTFGFAGEITIGYAENMTWDRTSLECEVNMTAAPGATEEPFSPGSRSEFILAIREKLGLCPKR